MGVITCNSFFVFDYLLNADLFIFRPFCGFVAVRYLYNMTRLPVVVHNRYWSVSLHIFAHTIRYDTMEYINVRIKADK